MARQRILIIEDFTGGLNLFDREHQLQINQSPYTLNAVFNKKGGIKKRFGFDRVAEIPDAKGGMRGLVKFVKLPTEEDDEVIIKRKLVCVHNNFFYYWEEKNNIDDEIFIKKNEIGSAGNNNNIARGVIYDNKCIIGDGVNETKIWNGEDDKDFELLNSIKSNCFLVFNEILLARDSQHPAVVKYPDPADITNWIPAVNNNAGFLAPEANNGEKIKGLAKFQNKLFIFKETGKFSAPLHFDSENAIIGFSTVEFDDGDDGAKAPYSILNVNNSLFFLGENGFSSYGMQENFPDRRASKNFSFTIQELLDTISTESEEKISSLKYKNKYFVSLPLNGDKKNNTLLYFDNFYNSWGLWDIAVQDFAIMQYKGKNELFFTSSTEPTLNKLNNKYIDDFSKNATNGDGRNRAIHFIYETPQLSFDKVNRIDVVRIEGFITSSQKTKVTIITENNESDCYIKEEDILKNTKKRRKNTVGGFSVGQKNVGGEQTGEDMHQFIKIIQVKSNQNENNFLKIRIENNEIGEGIEIKKIEILGEKKTNSLKKK